ncbi:MAG TPA: alkaline phosphatase family protein [Candidatus Sulfotelmatobacter sp.]|nr:alkaline phosphatase family protein [Candidatus Sulfotelmatobacter sp.]
MSSQSFLAKARQHLVVGTSVFALLVNLGAPVTSAAQESEKNSQHDNASSPIKHVIVIIGENRTFDHVFATYQPKSGETVSNLLSKGIVNADGTPGPNFALASQSSATDSSTDGFQVSPSNNVTYSVLPPVLAGGYATAPFSNVATAKKYENGLPNEYYVYLTTGGTGLAHGAVDTRVPNATTLPSGPFQLTSATLPYDSYTNSPVHRFYQMWQQFDCNVSNATSQNPSGCKGDLFPWVEDTIGAGSNGLTQPAGFNDTSTKEGSTAMGFYNMLQGDAPYLKYLADNFAMSDNFHQSVMGGTGANHVMLGTGDAIWFADSNGNPAQPPHNQLVAAGSPNAGVVDEIENPNPQSGTNNYYTEDGYGGGSYGSPSYGGGTYTNCADATQPGVAPIASYLSSLARPINPNCDANHFYLLNNYNPGYYGNGSSAYADIGNPNETVFTIPPSPLRDIGDELNEKNVSWAYYGDQWATYLANPDNNYVTPDNTYCNICNPFQYSTSIMTSPSGRAHLQDTTALYQAIKKGTLPAVSYVKPDGWLDGHPASSKLNLFEGFVKKIVDGVQSNKALWDNTAVIVTFDEGGGYYDSGYIQPLDYFGDGTRIPTLVVSKYTKAGHISHTYADHVSILKFIEANWGLAPLTARSRDNFPNPVASKSNPYVPANSPAIGDLMDLFSFTQ